MMITMIFSLYASACRNTGNGTGGPSTDYAGNPRSTTDVGAMNGFALVLVVVQFSSQTICTGQQQI